MKPKKLSYFIYITHSKHFCVIMLGDFKSDQKYFARQIRSLKKSLQQFESFSDNMPIVGDDLLRVFYRFFYLQFYDSSDQ